jgi:hypothetical protein
MIIRELKSSDLVFQAFRLLKQDVYYDKMDLFLRANLADYEANNFDERQRILADIIDELRKRKPAKESIVILQGWYDDIKFKLLPKSVSLPGSPSDSKFITNVRTADRYLLKEDGGVQYFIDAPVELYILSTLWCMISGPELDKDLDPGCFGNRLELNAEDDEHVTSRLFKIFHFQYTKWRDTAIKRAEELLDNGTSSTIVSLDIKQCYYHLQVDWSKVPESGENGFKSLSRNLNKVLKNIHECYHKHLVSYLAQSHPQKPGELEGIPIGLPSSRVLANWILSDIDADIREKMQPAYYGRYVDDILIVAQAPSEKIISSGMKGIVEELFIRRFILKETEASKDDENSSQYAFCCLSNLFIQGSKLIVQHFDKHHSRAGLKEFIEKIKRDASDFHFLPADEKGRELDSCAYDIIYEGSANKLRSVIGITENSTELSKYLARRMVEYRLTSDLIHKNIAEQLDRFVRGKNILDFCTTWERILTLLIVKNQHVKTADLLRRCISTIDSLEVEDHVDAALLNKVKVDLKEYLCLALAMSLSLMKQNGAKVLRSKKLVKLIESEFKDIDSHRRNFRSSNLMRHSWVAWPLLNYTEYNGSLVCLDMRLLNKMTNWDIDDSSKRTPRHIHEDERKLFHLLRFMSSSDDDQKPCLCAALKEKIDDSILPIINCIPRGDNSEKLAIGIANLHVDEKDISASYEPLRSPNTSWERQVKLFELLNRAEKEKCDILVLPEVSVPHSWLPFMVGHARRTQIALVFGLEHWVRGNTAYNLIVTILPYKDENHYKSCDVYIRPKNHYSPAEEHELSRLDLFPPKDVDAKYFLFDWRGARFTAFNCYELSDIQHRSLFRAKIDFMVSVEWNKDTKYFSNIVESAVRDLSCYFIQVNTACFGDSRITSPSKSEKMNVVQVTGGMNSVLLKAEIDIKELNDFRSKKYSPTDDRFKPTSAGFEHEVIRQRNVNKGRNTQQ